MKKTVLLIFLSFSVAFLHAQLKLDSIVNPGDRKEVYFYDNEGFNNEFIGYDWIESEGKWEPSNMFTQTETDNNLITTLYNWNTALQEWTPTAQARTSSPSNFENYQWSTATADWVGTAKEYVLNTASGFESFIESWDPATQSWIHASKITHLTDQSGNVIELIGYRWINNAWALTQYSQRRQFSLDAEGRVLEETEAKWNPWTLTWANLNKRTWEYNALGQETDYAGYYWKVETNQWVGQLRFSSAYENSHIISQIESHWNGNGSFWEPRWQHVYTYNPDSTLATVDLFGFDDELENWTFVHHQTGYLYTYTPEGKLSEQINSQWHPSLEIMTYNNKTNYAYDEAGNIIDYATYKWNAFLENWYNVYREKKEYDLTAEATELIYPQFYSGLFELGKLSSLELYSLDPILNDWHLDSKAFYYFSEFITATNETHTSESLKLFPNPVGDLLTIAANAPRASSYQIIDLNGRILQQEKAWNGAGIDVSRLIPGSYVIRLIAGNRVITGKFIKS